MKKADIMVAPLSPAAAPCPSLSSPNGTLDHKDPDPIVTGAEFGLAMSSPVAGGDETPQQWDRHRHAVMTDLAPVGTMETLAAEDVAHILFELDRCRRYRVKAIDDAQVHLELDVEAMVKNPKLARTRIEKIVIETLRPCYDRNSRRSTEETDAQRECDHETIRAGLRRLREQLILPNEDQCKVLRSEEGALRRACKDAMAELRRLRKERQSLERAQKPTPNRRPRPEPIDHSTIPEPINRPAINRIESGAILHAIAALLQPTLPDAAPVETSATLLATQPQALLVSKPVQVNHVGVPAASVNEDLVELGGAIHGQPAQVEQARAAPVEPGPSPPVTLSVPPEKPRPNGIVEAPIVRPPTQQGNWVGLGGIPILYEKPKPRV